MTSQSPPNPQQNPQIASREALVALNILTAINKMMLKVFSTKDRNTLIFLMLNDSVQIVRYDRAVLWSFEAPKPKLLGVSGQSSIKSTTDIAKRWKALVKDLPVSDKPQILSADQFVNEKEQWQAYIDTPTHPSVLWFPIMVNGKRKLGLWLERWNGATWTPQEAEILGFLVQSYGVAWERFSSKYAFHRFSKKLLYVIGASLLVLLFLVRIPLRIVAPCEVVPNNPILITAPLEDIIESVRVQPGDMVKKGDILFSYDTRVALQTLKVAENQLQVATQDLARAKTLAFTDERSLAEISVLDAKAKKEEANLALARYRASQLIVNAPDNGIVILDNPDEWRGKPVHVGEKVMMIANPNDTKIRLWIPENDNIVLDLRRPIYIFLNVSPTITREAHLDFISNSSTITAHNLVSFLAEAQWAHQYEDVRMGLKGSAILYGERVTLFYWIMRKPWASFRHFIGF